MGSGRGRTQRAQTQLAGVPQALEQRLQKKTFYSANGKPFVVFGAGLIEANTIGQMQAAMGMDIVRRGSLQADGHFGYSIPIGGVVATKDAIIPAGAGYDIGCGMRCAKLNVKFADIQKDLLSYLQAIQARVPIGLGQEHKKPIDHEIFDYPEWQEEPFVSTFDRDGLPMRDRARTVLGSVGSGNHCIDLCEDEDGNMWSLIHFGSRSPGYKAAEFFIKLAEKENPSKTGLSWLDMSSDAGQSYWMAHNFAGEFAYAGRNWVGDAIKNALGAEELEVIHNHHNFVFLEEHNGEDLFVHRKGATPASEGEMGIIPGSMADPSYVVRGKGNPESLRSSSHGAGRIMSRTAAHGKWDKKKRDWKVRPQVTQGAMKAWLKKEGVVLLGGDLDESPHVYKRIDEVIAAQQELVEPIIKLHPRGVIMSPPNERKKKMMMGSKPLDDFNAK